MEYVIATSQERAPFILNVYVVLIKLLLITKGRHREYVVLGNLFETDIHFFSKTFTFKSEGNRLLKYPIIFITFFSTLVNLLEYHYPSCQKRNSASEFNIHHLTLNPLLVKKPSLFACEQPEETCGRAFCTKSSFLI